LAADAIDLGTCFHDVNSTSEQSDGASVEPWNAIQTNRIVLPIVSKAKLLLEEIHS
jgi:hypothetical protein